MRLIGLQTRFISGLSPDSNAGPVIGPLWGQLHARAGEIQQKDATRLFGYTWFADPATRSRDDELEYLCGAEAAEGASLPEGMVEITTAASLYAIFEHRGSMLTYGDTLKSIYGEWLPASEYEGNGLGDVELYDERWSMEGPDSIFECWIGIKPKA